MSLESGLQCVSCSSENIVRINTYKRHWHFCRECGDASPVEKAKYPWDFLPAPEFKKGAVADEADMYNYFVEKPHIEFSVKDGLYFIESCLDANRIDLKGKRVLDISGGNGHVADELRKRGANVTLTEINLPALAYAKETLGLETRVFNFNTDRIHERVTGPYDIVCLRAVIMFCRWMENRLLNMITAFCRCRPCVCVGRSV